MTFSPNYLACSLKRMADAGAQIVECYRVLQKGGLNIVGEVLKGQGKLLRTGTLSQR